MTSPVDIRPDHLRIVQDVLETHLPAGVKVWVFGSRAQWSAREGSDLDLALEMEGAAELDRRTMDAVADAFEDSDLPYGVDIVDLNQVSERFRTIVATHKVRLPIEVGQDKNRCQDDEWREVALGDLIEIKHGFAFKGAGIHDEPRGEILLTPGNFAIGGGFKADRFKYYDGHVPDEFVLNEGDLLVTMTDLSKQSDTLGYPALVPASPHGHRYLHNQRLGKIIPKGEQELCSRYIYYVMCGAAYRQEVLASATGTTVKHTAPERIKQYRFKLPTLPDQRAIAHILGTLDDRIALNRRMNETLEEMARALFKSWFVDFDPVRVKMDGRWQRGESLPGLPGELYDLFPDRLVASELGEIPNGWENEGLHTISDLNPESWSRANQPVGVKYVDLANTKWGLIENVQHYLWNDAPSRARRVLRKGDTIVGTVRPGNGSYALVGYDGLTGSTGFAVLRPTSPRFRELVYLAATRTNNIGRLSLRADGAAYPAIRPEIVAETTIAIPVGDTNLLDEFSSMAGPLFERMDVLKQEATVLATQRDGLLPKLMSGELRVQQPQRI